MLLTFDHIFIKRCLLSVLCFVWISDACAILRPVSRPPRDFVSKLNPERELSFWEKQIQKQATAKNYKATKGELALATSRPLAVWNAIDWSLEAHLISSEICELPEPQRDLKSRGRNMAETDAVRHFVGSALVTYELGPKLAERFLIAHEVTDFDLSESSRMDIYNNQLGVNYAINYLSQEQDKGLYLSTDQFIEDLKKEALLLLDQGEFSVLRAENKGECRRSSFYPNRKHRVIPNRYQVLTWYWQE